MAGSPAGGVTPTRAHPHRLVGRTEILLLTPLLVRLDRQHVARRARELHERIVVRPVKARRQVSLDRAMAEIDVIVGREQSFRGR